jgi:hypothetical protein
MIFVLIIIIYSNAVKPYLFPQNREKPYLLLVEKLILFVFYAKIENNNFIIID